MFPLGDVGRDMVYTLITNFLLTYILFTRGLSAAQLTAVTAIMVGAFDALNDPIMGNIIERTRTRWGKFKPWLVIGILSTSVVVYLTFNTDLQGWSFIWFFDCRLPDDAGARSGYGLYDAQVLDPRDRLYGRKLRPVWLLSDYDDLHYEHHRI